MTQPSHDAHQGQPQDPSRPGSPYDAASGSPGGHPGTAPGAGAGAPVYDQYAPTGAYPQGFVGAIGGPFQGGPGQGGTAQADAPASGQGRHPGGYPQQGPSQPGYQRPGHYRAGGQQPAPYQQPQGPAHSPYQATPPAQRQMQPAPQPAASSAAPVAYSGYQAVAHNPQPLAASTALAQAAPGTALPSHPSPVRPPAPQTAGAMAAAVPQMPGPAMDPRTKGPSIVMGASAVVILVGLVLFVWSVVSVVSLNDGMSGISTNGAVRAELRSGQDYGLYHKSGEAPVCTVSDPNGREVSVSTADNEDILGYLHFGTFTAGASGAHVITCEGHDGDSLWASQLVADSERSTAFAMFACGTILTLAAIIPLIGASVVRARRRKAFLRAHAGTAPAQAVGSTFGQGPAWQ